MPAVRTVPRKRSWNGNLRIGPRAADHHPGCWLGGPSRSIGRVGESACNTSIAGGDIGFCSDPAPPPPHLQLVLGSSFPALPLVPPPLSSLSTFTNSVITIHDFDTTSLQRHFYSVPHRSGRDGFIKTQKGTNSG